jgi:hypothetical protein
VKAFLALALLATALAGCATPAQPPDQGSPQGAAPAAPAAGGAPGTEALAAPPAQPAQAFALHLHPDLTLAVEPSAEAVMPMAMAANHPEATDYPTWVGTLPAEVNVTRGVPIVFWVQANTASVRASTVPIFAQIPAFGVNLQVGDVAFEGALDGPQVMAAGEVHEVRGLLDGRGAVVPAGAEVRLTIWPLYTHATQAAEVAFVMGPEHPSRLDFGPPAV